MRDTHRPRRRLPAIELVAELVWVVGASASYFAGALFDAAAAVGGLFATFVLTLAIAALSIGWRAVPRLLAALLLQAPLVVGLGLYALSLRLGEHRFPCFFWEGTNLEQLEAFTLVAALSLPVGFLLRIDGDAVERLRWLARRAAPVATAVAAVLVVLAAVRVARFPTPAGYVDALPLEATIPSPRGQPCTLIENKVDPEHDPGGDRRECATPEVEGAPFKLHYHGEMYDEREPRYFSLHYRDARGRDNRAWLWMSAARATDLPLRRDDSLKAFFIQREGQLAVLKADDSRWWVSLRDLRTRVAPPLGWFIAGLAGLVAALACFGAMAALGDVASGGGEARQAWIAARRGDLSLVALAAVACSSALLVAALAAGFLT